MYIHYRLFLQLANRQLYQRRRHHHRHHHTQHHQQHRLDILVCQLRLGQDYLWPILQLLPICHRHHQNLLILPEL
jgi:hypothetical protein